ncbi:hypothetical protein F2Q70_00025199, partial [Brassica cretica]
MSISTTNASLIKGNITLEVSTRKTSTGVVVTLMGLNLMGLNVVHALTPQFWGENPSRTNYENVFSMHNPNNVREDAKLFAKRVLDFFSELTLKVEKTTSDGFRIILYAAGEKKLGKNTLYAMVQCLELTMDCKNCLTWST